LLLRNLSDVFGENDPVRRRAAIDEIFCEDAVFYDPQGGIFRGRDEIDRIAGELRATHLDFRYQPTAEPEETGNGGRVRWVEGRPGEAPAYAGTDFIIARDGRIAAFISFSTSYPEMDSRAATTSHLSWETGIELPTLRDPLKDGGREGIITPGLLIANSGENKLRQGATIT
jgi:hypothetical protein